MTDDESRSALLDARGGFAPFTVVDHIVVSRDRVTADDVDEVDRWVIDACYAPGDARGPPVASSPERRR